jgi:putative aldouronate transport system permease protein
MKKAEGAVKKGILSVKGLRGGLKSLRGRWDLLLIFSIPLAWYILFQYVPLYGVQIAFRRFNPTAGITGSPWVGGLYFRQFFNSYYFWELIRNTLFLSLFQMMVGFPIPIVLALLINEIRSKKFRKILQNVTYIPHFLSLVVIVSMLGLFSNVEYGLFNKAAALFGVSPVDYMAKAEYFRPLYVFSTVWQMMGFNSVIYIAALTAIDPALYEAAIIDGASRWQKIIHISLPCILPTIIILFILRIGHIME